MALVAPTTILIDVLLIAIAQIPNLAIGLRSSFLWKLCPLKVMCVLYKCFYNTVLLPAAKSCSLAVKENNTIIA
jgi:hypothetical protein